MCLAISNIAWNPDEQKSVYELLSVNNVQGLEIAPSLLFIDEMDPFDPSPGALSSVLREIESYNLQLVSMQSLLYGAVDAQLFGHSEQHDRFEQGLLRAVNLADRMNIPNLVMGSPSNRAIPDDMSRQIAEPLAFDLLRRVGDRCLKARTKLALEPNPVAYGTNFLNSLSETIDFLEELNHPAVSLNFDLGALYMNDEVNEAASIYERSKALVSHVHISEPHLAEVPKNTSCFATLARTILSLGYKNWFSIEMRAGDDNIAAIERAVSKCAPALNTAINES